MGRYALVLAVAIGGAAGPASGLLFEFRGDSADAWDFLDYTGEGEVYPTTDHSCPPGYGPGVLHIEGGVVIGMPKGVTLTEGTVVALYRENDPRDHDADGIIMVRAQYGMDVSVEHNVKTKRPHIWLEQDNDTGFQFRLVDAQDRESTSGERPGYGVVTDPWNVSRWIWQKVAIEGTLIRAKYWPAQEPEPEAWAIQTEYHEPGDRFGIRINSGDIHVAYFAADAADIRPEAPSAYLLFPLPRAAQTDELPLILFTNALKASAVRPSETFRIVVRGESGEYARAEFDAPVPVGHGRLDLTLATREARTQDDAAVVVLDKEPAPGLCTVTLSTASGAFAAERTFEAAPTGELRKRFDAIAAQIEELDETLGRAVEHTPKRAGLCVIRDAARAHLDQARQRFQRGDIEGAGLALRFAVEALSELSGYKGAWLRALASDTDLPGIVAAFNDPRGIGKPKDGRVVDLYSKDYAIRFGAPQLEAQSFVMGRSYEVVIPWSVEGVSPDRDFDFHVALVSPLGNRTPAASDAPPDTPTSQWQPGTTYEQRLTLEVSPEDPGGDLTRHEPVVLDEVHRVLVHLSDPATGTRLLLGNPPGPQPDRPGASFAVAEVYVSSTPIEVRGFEPKRSVVMKPRQDAWLIRSVGTDAWEGDALFTVTTETGRVVYQEAETVAVEPGTEARVNRSWTPDTAGDLTLCVRLMCSGTMVTQASREVAIDPPAGYDIEVVRTNHVETRGGRFVTPLTVHTGTPKPFFYEVRTGGTQQASGSDAGPSATIPAAPHFGYYDVLLTFTKPLGVHFRYDRRVIASVVETDGADLLVNGEPFIVKGTNVHGMDAGSPERTATMMRVMRDLGFNTWRGDYPARWQVDLAYELNTVYTVLAPFSCTSTAEVFGRQDGPPMATSRELTRLFVERYRDSAGVLLWNSCNEVGGECVDFLMSMYPVYKGHDPCGRPVHYANLYGQDYWQGQDVVGTNVYFGREADAASRQPIVERSLGVAREAGLPLIYCEFNSWAGPVQSTGADAFRGLFAWGVGQGMAGGFQYMKGNSDRHPGVFDSGYNTHKIHNDAIVQAFADAEISVAETPRDALRLRIKNKRRCTLRQMKLTPIVSRVALEPIALDDLAPEAQRDVDVPLRKRSHRSLPGPSLTVEGDLAFVTHFGFRCNVPIRLLVKP